MKIKQAILCLMEGKPIRRPCWEPGYRLFMRGFGAPMKIGNPKADRFDSKARWKNWAPTPLDLIADDWEVAE